MATNRQPQRKHAWDSDAVTGEPLREGTLRVVMRDFDPTRASGRRIPIPYQLHQPEPDGRLGGCRYHPAFARYLRTLQTRAALLRQQWYRDPAVLAHLANAAEAGDKGFTLEELSLALAWLRSEPVETDHTPYWVERATRRVTRYAGLLIAQIR